MKIISTNIRGLGSGIKKAWIKDLCRLESPDVIGIQETKIKKWNISELGNIWGGNDGGFAMVRATGNSGGLITCWNKKVFNCLSVIEDPEFLVVKGKWEGVYGSVGLINIYGPRDLRARLECWGRLENIIAQGDTLWCFFGDFNEVRGTDERLNSCTNERGVKAFNNSSVKVIW